MLEELNAKNMRKNASDYRMSISSRELRKLLYDIADVSSKGGYAIDAVGYNLSSKDIITLEKALGYSVNIRHEAFDVNDVANRGRRIVKNIIVEW